MQAGRKRKGLEEGIFACPLVLGSWWMCVRLWRTHRSISALGFFKIGSNFIQKVPLPFPGQFCL